MAGKAPVLSKKKVIQTTDCARSGKMKRETPQFFGGPAHTGSYGLDRIVFASTWRRKLQGPEFSQYRVLQFSCDLFLQVHSRPNLLLFLLHAIVVGKTCTFFQSFTLFYTGQRMYG